jgi:HEAT repeat protein
MGLTKQPDVALHAERRSKQRAPADLVRALADPHPGVRRWAALDLAGHRPAVEALAAAAGVETDSAAREAIFTTIAGFDSPEAASAVVPYLRSDDAALRVAAVDALSQMPKAAPCYVDGLLGSDDADLRILVVMVLASLRSPEVPRWLLRVIGTDTHANVVSAAIGVLGEVGDATMAAAVDNARARFPGDPLLRFSAAVVSARLRPVGGS